MPMRKRSVTKRNDRTWFANWKWRTLGPWGQVFYNLCLIAFSVVQHISENLLSQKYKWVEHYPPHNVVHNKIVSCILPCKYLLESLKKWHLMAEDIQCVIEEQVFVVVWSGFFTLPSHPLLQQVVTYSQASCVSLTEGKNGKRGEGVEPNQKMARKHGHL